jgi:hypothetical protein
MTPQAVRENIDFTVDYSEDLPNIYGYGNQAIIEKCYKTGGCKAVDFRLAIV